VPVRELSELVRLTEVPVLGLLHLDHSSRSSTGCILTYQ
jgi:hypothetical protein